MRRWLLTAGFLNLFLWFGALVGSMDHALATSASTPCGPGGTCSGSTTYRVATEIYWAKGKSNAANNIPGGFAWIRGTNIYHQGEIFEEAACNFYNSKTCTTSELSLCGTQAPPAGCGSNNLSRWYGTTWHYFDTGQGTYSLFTATDSGRANSYCWNNMTCF